MQPLKSRHQRRGNSPTNSQCGRTRCSLSRTPLSRLSGARRAAGRQGRCPKRRGWCGRRLTQLAAPAQGFGHSLRHPQQLRRLDLKDCGELGNDLQSLRRGWLLSSRPRTPCWSVRHQAFELAGGEFEIGRGGNHKRRGCSAKRTKRVIIARPSLPVRRTDGQHFRGHHR